MIPILQQITPTIIIIKIEIIFPNTVATIIRYASPFSLTVHFFNSYNTTYRYTGQQADQHLHVDDVNETLQIRSALESYCTLQIARESDTSRAQALFAELNELLYKMETVASTSHSIETFCQYDFQFHTSIINSLNNKQFTSLFASLMYRMRKLAELSLLHEDRMTDTCAEHRAILNAMQSGDTAHIYEITIFHMEQPKTISLEDL